MSENFFEGFFAEFFPFRCRKVQYFRNWLKSFFIMRFAEPVPWTNILAYITAKHPVLKFALLFFRDDLIFQFYREIRNTLTSIDGFIRKYSASRTRLEAPGTTSAIILCKRIIIIQFEVCY